MYTENDTISVTIFASTIKYNLENSRERGKAIVYLYFAYCVFYSFLIFKDSFFYYFCDRKKEKMAKTSNSLSFS